MEKLQRLPFKARNAVFQRLEQIVDIAAMSKEDRMKYDESIKVYRDKLAVTAYAEEKDLIAQITGLSPEAVEQLT